MVDLPILPRDLPDATEPLSPTDVFIVDQGSGGLVSKVTATPIVDSVAPLASEIDAQIGTDNIKRMSSLRVKQSISSEVGVSVASYAAGQAGLSAVQTVNGKSGNSVTLVKADIALGNVDNTSDLNKPISTATQSALNLKANASVNVFSGAGLVGGGNLTEDRSISLDSSSIASLAKADSAIQSVNSKTGSSVVLNKADVGLGSVDNTSDVDKPVSTAQAAAIALKANAAINISAGTGLTGGGTLAANRTIALSSASIASLALADSAVQPAVLNDYATLTQLATKFNNPTGTISQYIRGDGSLAAFPSIPQGTVTSVGLSSPTGFSVSGSPVTSSGTLALSYAAGYQGYTTEEATKLAGVQAGAQVNTVNSVAGKTGTVTLVKGDVGLGNVDNTSDASKPISTATQTALNAKANSAVTITAGAGLSGGGDLTANRTVSLNAASVASLALADSATQPSDLGALATKDQVSIADINATGTPNNGTFLRGDGSWSTVAGAGTVTSVAMTVPTGLAIAGSPITGAGTLAITYTSGYQGYTTAEATKLSGIAAGAQVNTVTSVAGRTGAVTLTSSDVGLGNVANKTEAQMVASGAIADALSSKANNNKIQENTTIFVSPSGSDSNSGLTSGLPVRTIKKAQEIIYRTMDLNGFHCTIKLANGAYPEAVTFNGNPDGWANEGGNAPIALVGNTENPSLVSVGIASGFTISARHGAVVDISGIRFEEADYALVATSPGTTVNIVGAVEFAQQEFDHIASSTYSAVNINASYKVLGGAMNHIHATEGGSISYSGGTSVTIENNPNFWGQFAGCAFSVIKAINTTFTGSATGKRFLCHYNGEIRTETFNRNLFPGNIPGEVQSGGMYDYPPYTSFSLSADASLPNATPTLVPFDVTNDNVNGMLIADVKIQPLSGFFTVEATLSFSGLTAGQPIYIIMRKNGVDYKVASKIAQASFDAISMVLSSVKCNGNDYFQVFTQVNGSGVSIRGGETLTYASARQL